MFNLFKETVTMHHLVSNQQNMLVTIDRDGTVLSCTDIDEDNCDDAWGLSVVVTLLLNRAADIVGDGFVIIVPSEIREATKISLRSNIHNISIK